MVKMNKQRVGLVFRKSVRTGSIVGVLALALAFIISWLNIKPVSVIFSTIDIRQQIASRGVFPQFGQRLLDFFQNIIPVAQNVPAVIMLGIAVIIGAILVVFVGRIIHELAGEFTVFKFGKTPTTKLALQMFLGAAALTIVLTWWSGIGLWGVAVAMFIYFVILSLVMTMLINIKAIKAD